MPRLAQPICRLVYMFFPMFLYFLLLVPEGNELKFRLRSYFMCRDYLDKLILVTCYQFNLHGRLGSAVV